MGHRVKIDVWDAIKQLIVLLMKGIAIFIMIGLAISMCQAGMSS